MRNQFAHAGMVAAENQLRRRHTLPVLVERELEDDAGFHSRLIGLGAHRVTEAQVLVRGEAGGALRRKDEGDFRLNLQLTRVKLDSGFELWNALIERPHAHAQARGFEQAGRVEEPSRDQSWPNSANQGRSPILWSRRIQARRRENWLERTLLMLRLLTSV